MHLITKRNWKLHALQWMEFQHGPAMSTEILKLVSLTGKPLALEPTSEEPCLGTAAALLGRGLGWAVMKPTPPIWLPSEVPVPHLEVLL